MTADYTIIMSRTLKFARFVPTVKKQKHDFLFSVQCIIKQLLDSVFVISRIIKVLVGFISLSLLLQLITPTHLDFSGYHNNLIQ